MLASMAPETFVHVCSIERRCPESLIAKTTKNTKREALFEKFVFVPLVPFVLS
jgi:hypothetical protein